jgi:hypothetical protein
MSEHEKDNDNLSRFFQKAAQRPLIKFEESDWNKLEALLDARPAGVVSESPTRWTTIAVSVIAIILLSVGTYMFTTNDRTSTDDIVSTVSETKDDKSSGVAADSLQNVFLDSKLLGQSQSTGTEPIHRPNIQGERVDLLTGNKSTVAATSTDSLNYVQRASQHSAHSNGSQFRNTVGLPSTSDEASLSTAANGTVMRSSLADVIPGLSLPTDSIRHLPPAKAVESIDVDTVSKKYESAYPSRWSILLTLSPDFSSAGLRRFTAPGEAAGVLVYYRLNSDLSISTGAIKSNKIYEDYGTNYRPNNESFWAKNTNGVTPGEVRGSCSILEIPIGIQYNLAYTKRSEIYVAAGFSSYVMLKESYNYTFSAPNPGAVDGWSAKKTTYYPFSMVNVSVGYERSISRRATLGISPYIKVPITSIGAWANVKLYSLGAAFTVRYNLERRNRGTPGDPRVGMN